ncbi:MAG TPA: DUF362 domain-containing protein, partial [Myxococcota bacterium]|nr:DUF362 domain-containing protein [Myxococcota bacterium]
PELEPLLGSDASGPANHVYEAVRSALFACGLDAARYGTPEWNPLGSLAPRGARIVLKPNFIRHWNPVQGATVDSVITHGSVVRAVADYAFLAAGAEGSVAIAEAPQHDCQFQRIREITGLDELVDYYDRQLGLELETIDLRREEVTYRDGVIVERRKLAGDPAGYRLVDLATRSAFHGSSLDPRRFRGADYDPGPTSRHHMDGRNEYLLSETVLSADLVVNLPKLKTHKKTGVTLALKNLVGINGDKNLLPHHSVGSPDQGGDEYPGGAPIDRLRSAATEVARVLLRRGIGNRLVRLVRRAENAARGDAFIRSGNWHGNQTTWRMCLDLNRCLYYSDARGTHFDAPAPVRTVLTVLDGVIAGEGEGPLAPRDVPLGAVLAATDPIALDLAAIRLMGFEERNIPKIREPMRDPTLRITAVRQPDDVRVFELPADGRAPRELRLEDVACSRTFEPHPGWRGKLERTAR